MGGDSDRWPGAAHRLFEELAGAPGRVALICGEDPDRTAGAIADAVGSVVLRVGQLVTATGDPPAPGELLAICGDARVLVDLEVLFDPELATDPLALLRNLARRVPRVAVWPGRVAGRRAIYSEPGRRDHFDHPLDDALVLRPRPAAFPDEVPYTIERVP